LPERLNRADVQTNVERTRWIPIREQADLAATTLTTIYTVPKKYHARVRVFVSERGGAVATVRIAVRKDGDAIDNAHYIAYDTSFFPNEDKHTEEIWLFEDDIIAAYASTGNISVNVNGRRWPSE